MGQYAPDKREVDARTVERATYVPDLRERAPLDSGEFLGAMDAGVVTEDDIHAELGEVVAGVAEGRTSEDEITLFDSGGTGIETVAGATLLYEKAVADDRGTEISFAPASEALTGR
jgi:alanine dehydrogenase